MTRVATSGFLIAALTAGICGGAAADDTLRFLTWNHPQFAEEYQAVIDRFEAEHPGVTVEWVDKPGAELPAYFQTQLVAGSAPDVVQLQGALFLQYADDGILMDITDMLQDDEATRERFNPQVLELFTYQDRQYLLPTQFGKTVLYYDRQAFADAGLADPASDYETFLDQLEVLTEDDRYGLVTLNFDWQFWPMMAAAGVDFLNESGTRVAFNTPEAVALVERLAALTRSGAISPTSWTGRWVENNNEFAYRNAAMLHSAYSAWGWFRDTADWADPSTLGVTQFPGGYATPVNQGMGITASTENPELAFELLKMLTSFETRQAYGEMLGVLTAHEEADAHNTALFKEKDPIAARIFELNLSDLDKTTGTWRIANLNEISAAVWPYFQSALLGQDDAADALAAAERQANRLLRRR
jgi:ABC-type glycerol-3-phosphate transport system substrate-binding protein